MTFSVAWMVARSKEDYAQIMLVVNMDDDHIVTV